jgi:hypothetical protein
MPGKHFDQPRPDATNLHHRKLGALARLGQTQNTIDRVMMLLLTTYRAIGGQLKY